MQQYIAFHLQTGEFAIPIMRVREIINLPEITRIPRSPAYLKGMTNLRGSIIPVVDLKNLIRVPGEDVEGAKVIVITSGRITFGLLVDGIVGVTSVDEVAIESPENLPHVHEEHVEGVAKVDGRIIVLLDVKKLLPLIDAGLLEDAASEVSTAGPDKPVEISRTVQTMGGGMKVREIRDAKAYFEMSKGAVENNPHQEIIDDIMGFMEAVSEQHYEKADSLIHKIVKSGQGDLFKEVGKITRKLHDAIKSFKDAVDPRIKDMAHAEIPNAVDQLRFVIDKTEEAANITMSVVEKHILRMDELSAHIRQIQGPPETVAYLKDFKNTLEDDLTDILTTQSFQDLTGQTIKKVITLVTDMENELVRLITSFGLKIDDGAAALAIVETVSQSDVDDLLKELGF